MMERLFAVGQQRGVFLMMVAGGIALGFAVDAARYARRVMRWGGVLLDILPAVGLLALLVTALANGLEALRLYSLLGIALGGALYAAGLAPVVAAVAAVVKKLRSALRGGRKSADPGEFT